MDQDYQHRFSELTHTAWKKSEGDDGPAISVSEAKEVWVNWW